MKNIPSTASLQSPRKLASILLIASAAAAQASVIVNESFDYSDGLLVGQSGTGTGFSGDWGLAAGFGTTNNNGANFFSATSGSLTMNGVYSSGGKLSFASGEGTTKAVTRTFTSPLSTGTLYGSYLFQLAADSGNAGRTVGGIMANSAGDTDNTATFVWAGNGYNNSNNIEGPNIRVEGTGTPLPTFSLTVGTTYLMLFEFNATTKTNSAWVLNQDQLTNFYGSLNSATLNGAVGNTEAATGVVWKGSATSTGTLGSMTNLTTIGLASTQGLNYAFDWDEIRISNSSLLEATAIPEPSTVAVLGLALGAFAVRGLLRRRNV
jgi:hypothetical protein